MLISYAIDAAISHGNITINDKDLEVASRKYSVSRLKDLGDEFAENYSNINIVLEYFYGLGNEFTLVAIEGFIQKLLVQEKIQKYCKDWFFNYSAPYQFIELLYKIGFIGIKQSKEVEYKDTGKGTNSKPTFDKYSIFTIHPTYHLALNLRNMLIKDLKEETTLKNEGILEDLPDSFKLDEYKMSLESTLNRADCKTILSKKVIKSKV